MLPLQMLSEFFARLSFPEVIVCVLIKLHIKSQSGRDILFFYATRMNPPYGILCLLSRVFV